MLFNDAEVKHFTETQKIKYIFDQLNTRLQPIELSKKYTKPNTIPVGMGSITTPGYIIYTNECNFANINNIKSPFPDFNLKVTEEEIILQNENFKMQFPPEQFLTIHNRIKKIKEL